MTRGIRDEYAADPSGATGFYEREGASYANPHEAAVRVGVGLAVAAWPSVWASATRILDLCCGAGEVTAALVDAGVASGHVVASDPYTGAAFERRHGRAVDVGWRFEDIAGGAMAGTSFDVIVCSYALHLCAASWLPVVCHQLAVAAPVLVVITPHKRPVLRSEWGWALTGELHDRDTRVRVRRYDRTELVPPA